jgi:hypothetical protein
MSQKKLFFCSHLEGHCQKKHATDPNPLVRDTNPDPYQNVTDPQH